MKQNMREPTVQEIAQEIGIAKEDIVYALDAIQAPMSLQEPVYSDGGDVTLRDGPDQRYTRIKKKNWVESLVATGCHGTFKRTGKIHYFPSLF